MIIYIELWTAKQSWKELPQSAKEEYMGQMQPSIPKFLEKGAKIHSWGRNHLANDHKSTHTWFAIWEFPNEDLITEFEALLQGAGWYNYFDQINACGENVGPEAIIGEILS